MMFRIFCLLWVAGQINACVLRCRNSQCTYEIFDEGEKQECSCQSDRYSLDIKDNLRFTNMSLCRSVAFIHVVYPPSQPVEDICSYFTGHRSTLKVSVGNKENVTQCKVLKINYFQIE